MKAKCVVLILLAVVAFVGSPALSQLTPEEETSGVANGRVWKKLDLQSKVMLLYGFQEGMTLLLRHTLLKIGPDVTAKTEEVADSLMTYGFRVSDVAKQVDEFYADTANIRIPILDAYVYAVLKIRGATKKEFDDHVVRLRLNYNK